MPGGTLTLNYSSTSIEVGTVTTISESFQKSCTIVPLVSMSVDDTFAVESKSSKTIHINFTRKNPSSGTSNASWISAMNTALNRWQCRTDGFELVYEPDTDNPYIAEINMNGYVKSFIYRLSAGAPEQIEGSLEFHVGTMYAGSQISEATQSEARTQSDFYVSISDSNGVSSYTLLGNNLKTGCISNYTLSGGPESPFEYLTMTIPRNRLAEVAPPLVEEDGIVAGRNRVTIQAVGTSSLIVTKCRLRNNEYTITAYCNAERLRGYTLSGTLTGTPEFIISTILGNGRYGVDYSTSAGNLIMEHGAYSGGNISFSAGKNVWYVLQVAAMCMGCRIFFANNLAYVVDYRQLSSDIIDDQGEMDLFPTSGNASTTVNTVSLGDEGSDTVVNAVQLRLTVSELDDDDNPTYVDNGDGTYTANYTTGVKEFTRDNSVTAYGKKSGNIINVEDLRETEQITIESTEEPPEGEEPPPPIVIEGFSQGTLFAENFLDYRCEPQQSIEFTVKEMHNVGGEPTWAPAYLPIARASSIIDDIDSVTITNRSDLTSDTMPQKLCLSTFERHYPQGTTTYVWGMMASIDLSSSTSQIVSSIDNL